MLHDLKSCAAQPSGAEIRFELHDIDFDPPSGSDIAGRVRASVVIEGDMLDDQYVRHFQSRVYDGEAESFEHVDEVDWQHWYGEEDEMPTIDGRNLETRIRASVAHLLNKQEELAEGVPEEEDVKAMLSECVSHYALEMDSDENMNWRVDIHRENEYGEGYTDVSSRFRSLLDVVRWIETEPKTCGCDEVEIEAATVEACEPA